MSETKTNAPKRGGWLRKLVWIASILMLLLVVVYFVATSSGFLTGFILPKVSKSLGVDVTLASAEISPFSRVALQDLKVQPPGGEPLVTVKAVKANYSLWSIIGGNIAVSEVTVDSPTVTIILNADGTCNLDALTKSGTKASKPSASSSTSTAKPLQIDIKKIALNNATVRLVKKYANGSQDVVEVSGLNFSVTDLKNGQTGKIAVAASIAVQKAAQTNAAAATVQAELEGGFGVALTSDLKPGSVQGKTTFAISQATGPLADLNTFAATLNCNLTPTELKELALRLTKGDASLGQIDVSGPFDAAKLEGKLKLEITGINKQVLNLAGAASGMDFGSATFNCTNDIEIAKGGKAISLDGNFNLAQLQVKRQNQISPTLDLQADYAVKVDQTTSSAVLQKLNLNGRENSNPMLQMGLSDPMTISWGSSSGTVGDATLNLLVTNLDLADWKAFAGNTAPGGVLNLAVKLVSQQSGKQLAFDVDTHLDNITTGTGSAAVSQGNVRVQVNGTLADMKQLQLNLCQVDLTRAGQSLGKVSVSGALNTASQEGKIKVDISGINKDALNIAGAASGLDFGTTTVNGSNTIELAKSGNSISLSGQLNIANLQVKRQNQISPTLNLHSDYDVTVDRAASSAVLQTFNVSGTENSQNLLQMGLSSPMAIGWGTSGNNVGEARLNLVVTNLNLADWKAFAGEAAPGGVVNVALELDSQKAGQQLKFNLDTHVDQLTTGAGNTRVNQGDLRAQLQGSVANLQQIKLDNLHVDLSRAGKLVASVAGNGTVDSKTQDADLQLAVQAALAQLLPLPSNSATNCGLAFKGHVTNQQKKITIASEVDLTPTDRAKNVLQLNGNVDVNNTAAISGNFKVAADSLDLTAYYDLLSSLKPAASNNPAKPAATPAPAANPNQEPAAVNLPLQNFTFDLNIGHLFLREIDVANWQTTAKIAGNQIHINPCQLAINGAPIKATTDLNLGVPGYIYSVAFNADAIPLTPLVNSFAPDRKGQLAGTTTIGAQITGAGITGASLQKNLAGQFLFNTTNMDLAIPNIRQPVVTTIVNAIIGLPELIANPATTLGNLLGGTHKSGWTDALMSSPLDAISMQANIADGKVNLQSALVQSPAFQAMASGQIVLDKNLTNSAIEIPVKATLSRSLGSQIGLVDANTPANAAYVALPDFLTVEGTVGNPKEKLDKLALAGLAVKTGGGIAERIGGATGSKIGSALSGVESLFGGSKSTTSTNAPAKTNSSPIGGLLNLFKK